jgi:hypothetical protein
LTLNMVHPRDSVAQREMRPHHHLMCHLLVALGIDTPVTISLSVLGHLRLRHVTWIPVSALERHCVKQMYLLFRNMTFRLGMN